MSTSKKAAASKKAPRKKQPLKANTPDGVPPGFPGDDAPAAEAPGEEIAPVSKLTPVKADPKAFKKATFQHAVSLLGNATQDSALQDEMKQAIEDQNYSHALAQRAADSIEALQSTTNDWLVKDLRSI